MLLQSAGLELIDILFRSQAQFSCLCSKLLPLHGGELFGLHSAFCSFGGQLLLHRSHLLWSWLTWSRHVQEVRELLPEGKSDRRKEGPLLCRIACSILRRAKCVWFADCCHFSMWPHQSAMGHDES